MNESDAKLFDKKIRYLFVDACVIYGYCLAVPEQEKILRNLPETPEMLVDSIMRGDGIDPMLYPDHFEGILQIFSKHLGREFYKAARQRR